MNFLSNFDFFGQEVTLNMNKTDKIRSNLGGILTVVAIALTILLSAGLLSDYALHQSPSLSQQFDYQLDPGFLRLNRSNFLWSITAQEGDFVFDSAYLTFVMKYRVYTRDASGKATRVTTRVPLKPCTKEYWKGFEADYDQYNLETYLCPTSDIYDLAGTFLADDFRFIKIEVIKCQNITTQPEIVCKPQNELDKILPSKEIRIGFFFTDTLFNLNDWENPTRRYVTNLHWLLAPGIITKGSDVFVKQHDIVTDDSLLLPNYWMRNYSTYEISKDERLQSYAPQKDEEEELFFELFLRKSESIVTSTRVFIKAETVLSTLGGLSEFFIVIFGALALSYNKSLFNVKLANTLYEFDLPKKKPKSSKASRCCKRKQKKKKRAPCNVQSVDKSTKIDIDDSSNHTPPAKAEPKLIKEHPNPSKGQDKLKLYVRSFQKYLAGDDKRLKFTILDFVLGLMCCKRRNKDKLVALADKHLEEDIDIVHIIKKVQDFDRLKQVFFNEAQLHVFSYSRPPLLTLQEQVAMPPASTRKGSQKIELAKDFRGSKRQSSLIRSFKRSRAPLRNKDVAEYDNVNDFALLFDNYRKLRRVKDSRTNTALVKLLDDEMQVTLDDLNFEIKIDEEFNKEYYKLLGIKAFQQLFDKARRDKSNRKLSKEDAANIIARRLQMRYKSRHKAGELLKLQTLSRVSLGEHNGDEITLIDRDRVGPTPVSESGLSIDVGEAPESRYAVNRALQGSFNELDRSMRSPLDSPNLSFVRKNISEGTSLISPIRSKLTYASPNSAERPTFVRIVGEKTDLNDEKIWGRTSRDSLD